MSYLRKTYGATVIPIEKFIGAGIENLDKAEFYSTKNEFLNLSIDVAAFNYAFYRSYIKWFITQAFNPKRLLDIGCENGILTNYYAKAYPGAEIIGIDTCANAIKCARELAQKMKLDNVRFEVADIKNLPNKLKTTKFDCVTAVTVFHEIWPEMQQEEIYWSIDSHDFSNKIPDANQTVKAIASLIDPVGGCMISVDRVINSSNIIKWIRLISGTGLAIDWQRCYALPVCDFGQPTERFISVSIPSSNQEVTTIDDIISFLAYYESDKNKL